MGKLHLGIWNKLYLWNILFYIKTMFSFSLFQDITRCVTNDLCENVEYKFYL